MDSFETRTDASDSREVLQINLLSAANDEAVGADCGENGFLFKSSICLVQMDLELYFDRLKPFYTWHGSYRNRIEFRGTNTDFTFHVCVMKLSF